MKAKWTKQKQEALERTMKALEKVRQMARAQVSKDRTTRDARSCTENQSA